MSTGYYCHTPPRPDLCAICARCRTDEAFRAAILAVPPPPRPARDPNRPRLSVADLVAKKRH